MADPRVDESEQGIANLTYDADVRAQIVIDHAHHEVHEGEHFTASDYASVLNGATRDFLLVTPDTDTRMHMVYAVTTDAKAKVQFFEGGNIAGGTAVPAYNNQRNSSAAAALVVTHTPAVTTTGTEILVHLVGSSNQAGARTRGDAEYVLKQNSKYLLRITAGANLDQCTQFSWYEELP